MTTPNYGMVLGTDDDQMSDVDTYLNSNFTKIQNAVGCPQLSVVPVTDFSYPLGSKIYYTPLKTILVLIASNSAWGNFWRPIQARYGPWTQPPSASVISNYGTIYTQSAAGNYFQYMLSNTGEIFLRGSVDAVDNTNGFLDRPSGASPGVFNNLPRAIAPNYRYIEIAAIDPPSSSLPKPSFAQISIHPTGAFTNAFWNPGGIGNKLFLDGLHWAMGYTRGYGSDN